MEAVREIWSAHNATLYLVNQETGEIVFKKVISESANPPKPGTSLPVGTGIVGWVIANKADRLILDTRADLDWYNKIGSDIRSMICVPLITKGQVLGAIQVLDRTPHCFDREDLETLKWLSASAAVTVHNVAQIEQARRKLIASESMAGLGAIAGKLAHNLKNQVAGIKTIAKYQLKSSDPKDAEKVERIIQAADQALIEVKSFMQPLTEWEPTNIDINEVLQDMIRRTRMSFEARREFTHLRAPIEIECHLSNQPLFVSAGKAQLEYIFHNIIDNAIRAIDERGKPSGMIVVKTFAERIHEAEWVVVTIEDSGIGIHQENIDRIFEPMFTTRPEGAVGGYGLFWVRLNVERLGGRVTASNRSGTGAIFLVRLPSISTGG
jgi:signal transduction histidine kinase